MSDKSNMSEDCIHLKKQIMNHLENNILYYCPSLRNESEDKKAETLCKLKKQLFYSEAKVLLDRFKGTRANNKKDDYKDPMTLTSAQDAEEMDQESTSSFESWQSLGTSLSSLDMPLLDEDPITASASIVTQTPKAIPGSKRPTSSLSTIPPPKTRLFNETPRGGVKTRLVSETPRGGVKTRIVSETPRAGVKTRIVSETPRAGVKTRLVSETPRGSVKTNATKSVGKAKANSKATPTTQSKQVSGGRAFLDDNDIPSTSHGRDPHHVDKKRGRSKKPKSPSDQDNITTTSETTSSASAAAGHKDKEIVVNIDASEILNNSTAPKVNPGFVTNIISMTNTRITFIESEGECIVVATGKTPTVQHVNNKNVNSSIKSAKNVAGSRSRHEAVVAAVAAASEAGPLDHKTLMSRLPKASSPIRDHAPVTCSGGASARNVFPTVPSFRFPSSDRDTASPPGFRRYGRIHDLYDYTSYSSEEDEHFNQYNGSGRCPCEKSRRGGNRHRRQLRTVWAYDDGIDHYFQGPHPGIGSHQKSAMDPRLLSRRRAQPYYTRSDTSFEEDEHFSQNNSGQHPSEINRLGGNRPRRCLGCDDEIQAYAQGSRSNFDSHSDSGLRPDFNSRPDFHSRLDFSSRPDFNTRPNFNTRPDFTPRQRLDRDSLLLYRRNPQSIERSFMTHGQKDSQNAQKRSEPSTSQAISRLRLKGRNGFTCGSQSS